jgi:Xaa-Pro aminopeptidase
MPTRRDLLCAATAAPVATIAAAAAPLARAEAAKARVPDLGFLRDEPLMDAERTRHFMREAGVDALVVAQPANVFYLTNHWPQLDRMGFTGSAIAVFPADPKRPLALVMHAFLYYYTHSPESEFEGRLVFPYTQPVNAGSGLGAGEEPEAAPARTLKVADPELLTPRERHRRAMFATAKPASADASWALTKALRALGLEGARLGIDDPALEWTVRSRGLEAELADGENLLRHVRLAKSPVEIRLMRLAAKANLEAAMAAARQARELGSTRQLRAQFFAEAAARGNHGVFMVINGSSAEVIDEPIGEGMALSIDCVSTARHYHGDFARTVFVGEPRPSMQRACTAIRRAWSDIQEQLKPGLRFADIPRIGRESLKKQGVSLTVSFRPHSVGLFHTDHPQPSLIGPRGPEALVLEENMILSVDCPVLEAGLGGTAHLEDLMLIRQEGAEPIHEVPESVIVV